MRFKVKAKRFEAVGPKLQASLSVMLRAQQLIDKTRQFRQQGRMIPLAIGIDLSLKELMNAKRTEGSPRERDRANQKGSES